MKVNTRKNHGRHDLGHAVSTHVGLEVGQRVVVAEAVAVVAQQIDRAVAVRQIDHVAAARHRIIVDRAEVEVVIFQFLFHFQTF